jgi:ABC-type multidrug transport system fused ATPase/permease subunit
MYQKFVEKITCVDVRKINAAGVAQLCRKVFKQQKVKRLAISSLLGTAVPLSSVFLAFTILATKENIDNWYSILFLSTLLCLFTVLLHKTLQTFSKDDAERHLSTFCGETADSAKGIQIFGIFDEIRDLFLKKNNHIQKSFISFLDKTLKRNILIIFAFFLIVVLINIIFFETPSLAASIVLSGDPFCIWAICFAVLTFISVMQCRTLNIKSKQITIDLENYLLHADNPDGSEKAIDRKKPLFLAFHGICFFAPSNTSTQIFNDLTFSLLPQERLAVIGPFNSNFSYIFDLVMKFYKAQSGSIYVSGTNINMINTETVRSLFSFFSEDFCLLRTSIFENIKMASKHEHDEVIESIAEKTGLFEVINENIFGVDDNIIVSQETLLRVQMARVFLQNKPVIFIKSPDNFENVDTLDLFYNFVKHVSSKRSVIIMTSNPETIIYSNKILFLNKDSYLFGSHAELSSIREYQKFMMQISTYDF